MAHHRTAKIVALTLAWFALGTGASVAQDAPASTTAIWNPCFEVRGGLDNCRLRFLQEKQGRIAYLGGSITTMQGWRDLTYNLFKTRFPETQFDFINAGIGGTNSTLGAFRFESDVFKNGPVDLLFLEFAVNDGGTSSPDNRLERAMEGIIRHARRLNPKIDIIVQYFADQSKVKDITEGRMPDSIALHEKVVRYYDLPAINEASEMTRRLNAGEFTWEQFSRDSCHPLPFGHEQYAGCIQALLDAAWPTPPTQDATLVDHPLPAPLDALNYENGRFIPIEQARIIEGWARDTAWKAEKTCNYSGPVNVLAAETPGATVELEFEGSLIGINAIAGMDAGIIECSVDAGKPQPVDMFDHYCESFHRPVCHVLAEDLPPGKHLLRLRMAADHSPKSQGYAARILGFVAN